VSTPAIRWFATPADFFEAMFGPSQHDAHVKTRHQRMHLERGLEAAKAGCLAVEEYMAEQREVSAQRVAADHKFDIASIDRAIAEWSTGFMAGDQFAPTRLHQLRRAREIAIETYQIAAE
jgi:hypothetical protein